MFEQNINRVLVLAFSAVIFILLGIKAGAMSFTHDEAFSWLHYVDQSVLDVLRYAKAFPNNHILNTLSMKTFQGIFGPSELALRAGSWLSFVLFAFSLYKICCNQFGKPLGIAAIILMANPYLLDFFCIARGYGPAISLLTFGLFQLQQLMLQPTVKYTIGLQLAFGLGMLSSFSIVPVYLAVNGVLLTAWITKKIQVERSVLLVFFLTWVAIFFSLYEPIRKIITYDLIDFAGNKSLVESSFGTLLTSYAYTWKVPLEVFWIGCWVLLTVVLATGWRAAKDWFQHSENPPQLIPVVTVLTLVAIVLQNQVMGTGYPIQRFATYLYPLVGMTAITGIDYLVPRSTKIPVFALLAGLAVAHTVNQWQPDSVRDWKDDKHVKNMILTVDSLVDQPTKIGVNWIAEPVFNYYKKALQLDNILAVDRTNYQPDDVFRFYRGTPSPSAEFIEIRKFDNPDFVLVKMKN